MAEKLQSPDFYYEAYGHFCNHEDLLKDKTRVEAFLTAMKGNPKLFENSVVLDAGCGTGILSMFAVDAGARHVYAVEKTVFAQYAAAIFQRNGYNDKISVIHGELEKIELPEKVDIIVCNWMGPCLFFESLISPLLFSRDHFLKKGGVIFPGHASLFIAGFVLHEYYDYQLSFWDHVYSFNFSCMKSLQFIEPVIDALMENCLITDEFCLEEYDLAQIKIEDTFLHHQFRLTVTKKEDLCGICVWFSTSFVGPQKIVQLSTSPKSPTTNWRQTNFFFKTPLPVEIGDIITGMFTMHPSEIDTHNYDVTINVLSNGKEILQNYQMLF